MTSGTRMTALAFSIGLGAASALEADASSMAASPPFPAVTEADRLDRSAPLPPSPAAPGPGGRGAEGPEPVPVSSSGADGSRERTAQPPLSILPSPTETAGDAVRTGVPESRTGETAVPARSVSRLVGILEESPARRPDDGQPLGPSASGCPRDLLTALFSGAMERSDIVSALAIERETLALCRERQEIVTGIVKLEKEMKAVLAEANDVPPSAPETAADDGPGASGVVSRLRSLEPAGDAAPATRAEEPVPAYAWFSIIGTPGRLRAGVSDGARVWWLREGDRLPGLGPVERIGTRPPGVRVAGGTGGRALPYGPRPAGGGR